MIKGGLKLPVPNLKESARVWRRSLYSKIVNCFRFTNLPEEINPYIFQVYLLKYGKLAFLKKRNKYYALPFSYAKLCNPYYVPKSGLIANAYMPEGLQTLEFDIEEDVPVIYNSTPDIWNYRKESLVSDIIYKTANTLAENEISYYCIQRNHRLVFIVTAQNDLQAKEGSKVIGQLLEGRTEMIMQEDLINQIKVNPISQNSTRNTLTELIEFQQYILGNFYHNFGINSNYNLKREQLSANEIEVNDDVLTLNVNDLLNMRKQGVEKINEKYGLNIEVELNPEIYKDPQSINPNMQPFMSSSTPDVSSQNENVSSSNSEQTSSSNPEQTSSSQIEKSSPSEPTQTPNPSPEPAPTQTPSPAPAPTQTPEPEPKIEITINAETVKEVNISDDTDVADGVSVQSGDGNDGKSMDSSKSDD